MFSCNNMGICVKNQDFSTKSTTKYLYGPIFFRTIIHNVELDHSKALIDSNSGISSSKEVISCKNMGKWVKNQKNDANPPKSTFKVKIYLFLFWESSNGTYIALRKFL